GRPDEMIGPGAIYQRGDLYVSARRGAGWDAPRHLGAPINSAATECCSRFSPDGRTLYFTSERGAMTAGAPRRLTRAAVDTILAGTLNGGGNPYRISAAELGAGAQR